jgi:hypothetical protein
MDAQQADEKDDDREFWLLVSQSAMKRMGVTWKVRGAMHARTFAYPADAPECRAAEPQGYHL